MTDISVRLDRALGGAYEIERELGGGGMSRVFLATERALARKVVVKVLAPELAGEINGERFAREARLAAQLQHPHMVPVLAAGDASGLPYYVMPYVAGETLRARIVRSGALPVRDAVGVLRDVVKALAFAHAHGIVHRDIKPENILLAGGSAVVSDFGIAKAITASLTQGDSALTQRGFAVGTPAYMAPEQAVGDPAVDHRADLYACGILAYEMLTGSPPFAGVTTHELVSAHLTQPVTPLASTRADVPAAISELVQRCLAKDPRDRPASADVILAILDASDSDRVPGAVPVGQQPRRLRLERLTGVAALAVIMLTAGAFVFMRLREPAARSGPPLVTVAAPVIGSEPSLASASTMTADLLNSGLSEMDWIRVAHARDAAEPTADGPAAVVVNSQLYRVGDSIQLQLRVTDSGNRQLLGGLPPVRIGLSPSLEEIRSAVGPALSLVGYATHPQLGMVMLPATGPPSFDAFREFAAALRLWAARSDSAAILEIAGHLRSARQLDSSFAQVDSWSVLNAARYYQMPQMVREVDSLLPRAERATGPRSPFEVALAQHAGLVARRATAPQLGTMRELARLAPRSIFAGALPPRLLDLNLPRQALQALDELHRVGGPAAPTPDDSRNYWAARADILHYLKEHEQELVAARRAREAGPDIRQVRRELRALVGLHRFEEAERRLDEANDASGTGPFDFAGDVYLQIGQEIHAHGDTIAGRRVIQRAVRWFEARTAQELKSQHVRFRAALAYMTNDQLDRALPLIEGLRREYPHDARYIGSAGAVYARTGRIQQADAVLAQLAALPTASLAGAPTYERARILASLGRREEAVSVLQEALRQGQGWAIRWRLHFFTEWQPYVDFPPFRRIITAEG